MIKNFKPFKDTLVLVLILSFAFISLLYNFQKPFIGQHDWNGAFWGGVARNYIVTIKKVIRNTNISTVDYATDNQLIFLNHYSPLLPLLFTLSGLVLGLSEGSMRIVTISFSILLVISIYKIGKHLFCREIGVIASLFTIVTPMFLYYGKLPDHEPILASLCTAAFYCYVTLKGNKTRNYIFFYFFLTLALLESWGGFFLLFFLIIHSFFIRKSKLSFTASLIICGIGVIILQVLLIVFLQGPDSLIGFISYGLLRMNINTSDPMMVRFSFWEFIKTESRYLIIYYTRPLIILSALWMMRFLWYFKKLPILEKSLSILLFYGICFIFIFNNLAYIHDYKLYLILPFITISSARTLQIIWEKLNMLFPIISIKKKGIYIKAVFLVCVIVFVALERRSYLNALLQSSFDKSGYELGTYLSSQTKPIDKILINSTEYDSFYRVFVIYYANRKIDAKNLTMQDFIQNISAYTTQYRYIVLVDKRPIDISLKNYLIKKYKVKKNGDYSLVDLAKKI